MKTLESISPAASEAFSALFGEDCKNLTRETAQDLIQAAMRFVSEQGDIDWAEVFFAGEYPVKEHWRAKTKKLYELSDSDMLGLVEFLTYHLRVGRWATSAEQIKHLAQTQGFECIIELDIRICSICGDSGISRKGDFDYILALLQRFDSASRQFPSQEDCLYNLNQFAEKLDKIETLTVGTENMINEPKFPLNDGEIERCNNFLSKLKCSIADFQDFIERRIEEVRSDSR